MHLHTVLWYGLLVWLLERLYRMFDPDTVRSNVATLIFAVSSQHLLTVTWLAARNHLIAGCFILLTIMCFHLWRQGKGSRYGVLALLTSALGLMCAEAGIASFAYLGAYALVYESDKPWAPRLKALLPFVITVVIWRVTYTHLGYGSSGSGGYIDPASDPVRFAQTLLLRIPTLLYASSAGAAVVLSMLVGQYFGLWSTRLARFYGVGALLALIPVCAALPNDRLLLNAEFGLSALLAMLFVQVLPRRRLYTGKLATAAKLLVAVLMTVHLLVYPLATPVMSALFWCPQCQVHPSFGQRRSSTHAHRVGCTPHQSIGTQWHRRERESGLQQAAVQSRRLGASWSLCGHRDGGHATGQGQNGAIRI
ncbi:MAG: hypothetical protein Q7U28_05520 [Aquabacterium sp.]|nr:hypothetical protein [Aquabacterium sp.]